MNEEEIMKLIDRFKQSGLNDEEILVVFFDAFKEGKMDRKDLETLTNALGYELTPEFKNDPHPDPIESIKKDK